MYTLRRQLDGEDMVLGNYTTYEAAADDAVPGHPDEWVWLGDPGVWFHGGGNFPGESFTVTPGPADPHP